MYQSPQSEIPVALVTKAYTYVGHLTTGGRRLQDILNDTLTDFLNLRKVEIATTLDGNTVVQKLPEATIAKTEVVLGLLRQDTHEAPIKRQNYRVQRDFCEAVMVIHHLRIQGAVHLSRATKQSAAILTRDLKSFFAVTDATVSANSGTDDSINASVVLVNKQAVSLLSIQ